ncbi:MAG: hypothetical protein ACLVJH_03090 [Faecalibacterium prausnitzii]
MRQTKRFAVVGSDARQAAAGRALARAGYTVGGAAAGCRWQITSCCRCRWNRPDLPLAAAAAGTQSPGRWRWAVRLTVQRKDHRPGGGVELVDYFARPELTVYNAIPTAEGCIGILLERRSRTLWGAARAAGWLWPVGQALAVRLAALGAQVTVAARRAGAAGAGGEPGSAGGADD